MNIQNQMSADTSAPLSNENSSVDTELPEFSPSQIKGFLSSITLASGKITRFLKSADLKELTVLGLLLAGDKNKEKRAKLLNLISQCRRGGALLHVEQDKKENLSFDKNGIKWIARRAKPEIIETTQEQEAVNDAAIIAASLEPLELDLIIQFELLISQMTDQQKLFASTILDDKLRSMLNIA